MEKDNIDQAEREAIAVMMAMTDQELELVPYEIKKWICSGKKCTRGTHVRDYGIGPIYYHLKMTITNADVFLKGLRIPSERWHNTESNFFMCAKHFKMWKRLIKNHDEFRVNERLFDMEKPRIADSNKVNKIKR